MRQEWNRMSTKDKWGNMGMAVWPERSRRDGDIVGWVDGQLLEQGVSKGATDEQVDKGCQRSEPADKGATDKWVSKDYGWWMGESWQDLNIPGIARKYLTTIESCGNFASLAAYHFKGLESWEIYGVAIYWMSSSSKLSLLEMASLGPRISLSKIELDAVFVVVAATGSFPMSYCPAMMSISGQ